MLSPCYLGCGDQPKSLITRIMLSSDNFVTSFTAMTLSLRAHHKFGYIIGTNEKPTGAKQLYDRNTVHTMMVSWLLRSIDSKLASTILFYHNAKELWTYLEKRFCIANGPHIQQLRACSLSASRSSSFQQ